MKRGWWVVLVFSVIALSSFVTAKTFNLSECWGATVCGDDYTCGVYDGLCPDDLFAVGSTPEVDGGCAKPFADPGFARCIDPDCIACINGTVIRAPPNPPTPIQDVTLRYEQEVWNGTNGLVITQSTLTDATGRYRFNVSAGYDVYLLAQAQGFTPDLTGPIFDLDPRIVGECLEVNVELTNGTCEGSCTRLGSIYCDASCQGQGIPTDLCMFNTSTTFNRSDYQGNISIVSPITACSQIGTQAGTFVDVAAFTHQITGIQTCVRVNCCEGNPFEVPCPTANVSDILISGQSLDDAIKVTRIARYRGEPVKIRVYYWE